MAKADTLRQDLLHVCEALEKRYGRRKPMAHDDFIEALVFQILEFGAPERSAKDALARIRDEYVDWNDMRVATVREIQDILGSKYVRCREKAEDLHSLLADLYTAFRSMDLSKLIVTQEGIETLRALPDTTLIRSDMVEWALLVVCKLPAFPCTEEQFDLLRFLGGVGKNATLDETRPRIVEVLDTDERLRLSRGLREHSDACDKLGGEGPMPIGFGWKSPDPLGMKVPPVPEAQPKPKPAPRPAPAPVVPPPEAVPTPAVEPVAALEPKPVAKPADKPATAIPADKPVAKPADKPASKTIEKPADKPVAKAVVKPVSKPVAKPAEKPSSKSVAKPAPKPAAKPAKPPSKPPPAKPASKPAAAKPKKGK